MSDSFDVAMDIWNFKDGQDKYAFIEKTITDPNIYRVCVICNKDYAEKVDSWKGLADAERQEGTNLLYRHFWRDDFLVCGYYPNRTLISNIFKKLSHLQRKAA